MAVKVLNENWANRKLWIKLFFARINKSSFFVASNQYSVDLEKCFILIMIEFWLEVDPGFTVLTAVS